VVVERVWPGVDWVLRYDERVGGVKQEFVVQGGYRWDGVRLRIWSRGGAEVSEGRLRVRTAYGEFVEEGLVGYYGSERVGVRYRVLSERGEGDVKVVEVGYAIAGVPEVSEKTLVIDPVLQWGTYFGGNGEDLPFSVAVDRRNGDVFVVGRTISTSGFPLWNPGGGAHYQGTHNGGHDAFIAKFSGSNLSRVWCTYFGGSSGDSGTSVAVDGSGDVFVVGMTYSSNFPLWNPGGGAYYQNTNNGGDAYIAKFSGSNLSRLWCTYFGGSGDEDPLSVAVDRRNGDVFVVGWTTSTSGFPLWNPGGGAYYDGIFNGIRDAFIAKFSGSNLSRVWSTYFGGSGWDEAYSVAVDGSGNVFVVGRTNSTSNFPLWHPGGGAYFDNSYNGDLYDAFIAKFSGSNLSRVWCTYFGGNSEDGAHSVAVDGSGDVFVVGWTTSTSGFPLWNPGGGAYYQNTNNGGADAFIAKFSGSNLSRVWSTYYGGSSHELLRWSDRCVVAGAGFIAVGVQTYSSNLPVGDQPSPCSGGFYQGTHGGGVADLAILTFDLNGVPWWRTFYGGAGHEESPAGVAVYSTYLYVVGATGGSLPASHLPNPGGGAYHDNTHKGSLDVVLLRFDYANCPLLRWEAAADDGAGDGRGRWEAWWDGGAVRVAGIEAAGWYSVMGMDGRVVGRWYVGGEGGALEGPWSPGLYVVYQEGSGESRRVYVGP